MIAISTSSILSSRSKLIVYLASDPPGTVPERSVPLRQLRVDPVVSQVACSHLGIVEREAKRDERCRDLFALVFEALLDAATGTRQPQLRNGVNRSTHLRGFPVVHAYLLSRVVDVELPPTVDDALVQLDAFAL